VAVICALAMLSATGCALYGLGWTAYQGGRGVWSFIMRIGR
jgi:hypothetical protein